MKEKSQLLLRFGSVLEQKCQRSTWVRYLQLVLNIYQEPAMARTELTVRLEPVFLQGCIHEDPAIRQQFMRLFDQQIPSDLLTRLIYVLGVQNWEALSNRFWLQPAVEFLLQPATLPAVFSGINSTFLPSLLKTNGSDDSAVKPAATGSAIKSLHQLTSQHEQFMRQLASSADYSPPIGRLLTALHQLARQRPTIVEQLWSALFTGAWQAASARQRHDLNKALITLLTKDFHQHQLSNQLRPNVVAALLDSAARCRPIVLLPPQVVKYLGKQFNCWHAALELLQQSLGAIDGDGGDSAANDGDEGGPLVTQLRDPTRLRELTLDATAELLNALCEDDYFIGLWRRRCIYAETNAALSFEQLGHWQPAQQMYESAQLKARNGLLPFSESEYSLWESRWIQCAQKLQQWDLSSDLARHDNNIELQLDCAWRLNDWSADREGLQNALMIVGSDQPTPRHKVFEAFLALTQVQENVQQLGDLQSVCDSGIQLTLRHWFNLPRVVGAAHLPLLAQFQQFVELQEASHIYVGVSPAGMQNRIQAVQELKGTLGTWVSVALLYYVSYNYPFHYFNSENACRIPGTT
jgi:transformation/transcription domain-associated protein